VLHGVFYESVDVDIAKSAPEEAKNFAPKFTRAWRLTTLTQSRGINFLQFSSKEDTRHTADHFTKQR
jgi:hypothetical protein